MATKNRPDCRVQRTKDSLHLALMSLIVEKSYGRIAVQDLIDRANIGRSTLYAQSLTSTLLRTSARQSRWTETPASNTNANVRLGVVETV